MSGFYDANEDPGDPLEQELKARPRPQPRTSLLRLLATAQDAVSRLDALASTAPASVRAGLVVRMGWREAAGWLSSVTAWAHPLDLALRAAGVLGSFAGAGKGFPGRAMPHTYAALATEPWQSMDAVQLLEAEEAVSTAIARASYLREDKPENGWIAEGRDFLAQPYLRAVAWPFWAVFGTPWRRYVAGWLAATQERRGEKGRGDRLTLDLPSPDGGKRDGGAA